MGVAMRVQELSKKAPKAFNHLCALMKTGDPENIELATEVACMSKRFKLVLLNLIPPISDSNIEPDLDSFQTLCEISQSSETSAKDVINQKSVIGFEEYDNIAPVVANDILSILEVVHSQSELSNFEGSQSFKEELGINATIKRISLDSKTSAELSTACYKFLNDVPTTNYHTLSRDRNLFIISNLVSWGVIKTEENARVCTLVLKNKMKKYSDREVGSTIKMLLKTLSAVSDLSPAKLSSVLTEKEFLMDNLPWPKKQIVPPKVGAPAPAAPALTAAAATGKQLNGAPLKHGGKNNKNDLRRGWMDLRKGGVNYCHTALYHKKACTYPGCRFVHEVPKAVMDAFFPNGPTAPARDFYVEPPPESVTKNT